jgi:hypothetical protein
METILTAERRHDTNRDVIRQKELELKSVQAERAQVGENMARAKTPEQYNFISETFDNLTAKVNQLTAELVTARQSVSVQAVSPEQEAPLREHFIVSRHITRLSRHRFRLQLARRQELAPKKMSWRAFRRKCIRRTERLPC